MPALPVPLFPPPPTAWSPTIHGVFAVPDQDWSAIVPEPSGLAASKAHADYYYTHSEDLDRLVILSSSGIVKHFELPLAPRTWEGHNLRDYEDIAVAPCVGLPGSCVWLGDIGRFSASFPYEAKTQYFLLMIQEPDIEGLPDGALLDSSTVVSRRLVYADAPRGFNAEALAVHPITGAVYVVESTATGRPRIYEGIPDATAEIMMRPLGGGLAIPDTDSNPSSRFVTAMDIDPSGVELLVRTYTGAYTYRVSSPDLFDQIHAARPTPVPAPRLSATDPGEGQGEAIAFAADGRSYFTISETPASDGMRHLHRIVAEPPTG